MESNKNQQNLGTAYSDSMLVGGPRSTESIPGAPSSQFQSTSFDIVFWFVKFPKYWYLLLIGLVLAVGIAYIKNKSWFPVYKSVSTILIQEDKKPSFGTNFGTNTTSNNNNQMIMYCSYDLTAKAVSQLNVTNELYQKGRFRNTNLYKNGPIEIESNFNAPDSYGLEFGIQGVDDTTYRLSFVGNDTQKPFEVIGEYGKYLQHPLFFVLVNKTSLFKGKYDLHFHFISKTALINDYLSRLRVQFIMEGASVMEASLVGPVAERDVDFLNILNQEFFADNLLRKNESSQKAINFINEQLMIIRDSITSSESKLNAYQMKSGVYTADKSSKTYTELDALEKKRNELRLRKEYLTDLDRYLGRNAMEILVTPASMGVTDGQLNELVSQYNTLSLYLKSGLKPENPVYKKHMTQLDETRAALNQEIQTMLRTLRVEEKNVEVRYGRISGEMSALPEKERELLAHERDFKINDSYNTYLLQRQIESQIQMASNAPDNVILNQPRVEQVVNREDTTKTYVLFVLAVIILYIIYIICKEVIFNFKVQSRDEVERLGLPILGTIERSNKKAQMMVKRYPKSGFAEGFRNLRSRMEYVARKESPISMLITSTEPKDGKTFIACNLASIYQLTGKKTIIVDFDLRRPAMSKTLEVGNEKGLSNYLIGQVELKDIIITHPEYDFDVISAGTIPPNPSELLRSEKTMDLLNKLKETYDYVVVDCSPVGLVSDAHFLARHVDVLLYVVRNEKTNRNFLRYTVNELREDQIANIAVIYNDVNLRSGYSGYGNKRYYGRSSYYIKHDSYYHNDFLDS